jgi:NTE family protein
MIPGHHRASRLLFPETMPMPVLRVTCPTCQAVYNLEESYRGKRIRCQHCRQAVTVPSAVETGEPEPQVRRLGVAFSGGGFRASFFHLGVLAQMARLGTLRHVEIISTVSGGSVIGALYYLHLKRLLEGKEDAAITDQDFRDLVCRLEAAFFRAVQQNLRVRSLLNPLKLIQTCLPDYSRTDHIGYLLDRYFFRPSVDPRRKTPIAMRELRIQPKGAPEDFRPHRHNAGRFAKVPVLLLNATTLNTGHNWRFEAARMGEPQLQTPLLLEIDKLFRLRRPACYEDLTPRHRDIELGLAVAASCCVPGLFPPLALSGLYDRGIRVQLVDGAVHDNQGIDSLLERQCTDFVISDASEQMREEIDPAVQLLPVVLRSTDILGTQLREEALFRLMEPGHRRVALLHLRKGLPAEAIAWLDQSGRPAAAPKDERPALETFGVPAETQEALSHMRSDLDAFTEVEAYSLMLDAYLMSASELRKLGDLTGEPAPDESCPWRFPRVGPWLRRPTPAYRRRLHVAQYRHGKLFRLKWPLTLIVVVALLAAGGWLAWQAWSWDRLTSWLALPVPLGVLLAIFAALGLVILPQLINVDRFPFWLRTPAQVLGRFVMRSALALVISTVSAFQLYVLSPLYQRAGRLDRLGVPPRDTAVPREAAQEELTF